LRNQAAERAADDVRGVDPFAIEDRAEIVEEIGGSESLGYAIAISLCVGDGEEYSACTAVADRSRAAAESLPTLTARAYCYSTPPCRSRRTGAAAWNASSAAEAVTRGL
jgi:hypothetical protein